MASIWLKAGSVMGGAGCDTVNVTYFETCHDDMLAFITDAYRDEIVMAGEGPTADCASRYYPHDADLS